MERERQREGKRHRGDTQRENRERDRRNSRERENDTEGVTVRGKKKEKVHGKKGIMCFMEKLFVSESLFFPCTVLCHMWEVREAGTPPKNICQGP